MADARAVPPVEATAPILSAEEIADTLRFNHHASISGPQTQWLKVLCDSHESLRAALAAATAERDDALVSLDSARTVRDQMVRYADEARERLAAATAPQLWCEACRETGAIHCANPESCGNMKAVPDSAEFWRQIAFKFRDQLRAATAQAEAARRDYEALHDAVARHNNEILPSMYRFDIPARASRSVEGT